MSKICYIFGLWQSFINKSRGCPELITYLNCEHNLLTSLIGCPESILRLDCEQDLLDSRYFNRRLQDIPKINAEILDEYKKDVFLILRRFNKNDIAIVLHNKKYLI